MGTSKFILLAIGGASLAVCLSSKVTASAPAAVSFHQFHDMKLVDTNLALTAYAKAGLPMFEGLLKGRLQSLGYGLVETNPELSLNVTSYHLHPGNRTMRPLFGFGAARAVLKYTAQFKAPSGKLLAEMEGGKAYHGLEMADKAKFKFDEATRMGMISYSGSQIGRFIQNNGREKKQSTKHWRRQKELPDSW